jgi:hypothetical protein
MIVGIGGPGFAPGCRKRIRADRPEFTLGWRLE